jgi:hypothetical protein
MLAVHRQEAFGEAEQDRAEMTYYSEGRMEDDDNESIVVTKVT